MEYLCPLVSPLVSPLVRPQEKFGSHIYRLICLMNHLKTHQTSLMAPWDPLNAPLDPLGPPGPPPIDPPMTPKPGVSGNDIWEFGNGNGNG